MNKIDKRKIYTSSDCIWYFVYPYNEFSFVLLKKVYLNTAKFHFTMIVFPAKKKGFFIYPLVTSLIPLVILYAHEGDLKDIAFELLLSLLPVALLIWVYFSTTYKVEGHYFHYRSAFIKGRIDILSITRLDVGKSLWVGTKPALGRKGIIITYNRFDEIYIAPLSNSDVVKELMRIHPSIEVVYHEK